jgi:hypothetical protein
VIKGYVNEWKFEEANCCYNEIEKIALAPNRKTFEMLLPFVAEKGVEDLAFELCKEIFKRKS